MKIKKNLKIFFGVALFICLLIADGTKGVPETSKETHHHHKYGCSCAWLQACVTTTCTGIPGMEIACIAQKGLKSAICLCKEGGMKHCDNWDQIISTHGCGDLKDAYCHGGGSSKCSKNDPVCKKKD